MHSYLPLLPYIIALILAAIVYVASQRVAPAEPVTPVATTPAVDSEPEPAEQDDDTPSPFVLYSYYLASRMAALGLGTQVAVLRRAGRGPLVLAGVLFAWLLAGGSLINAAVMAWLG